MATKTLFTTWKPLPIFVQLFIFTRQPKMIWTSAVVKFYNYHRENRLQELGLICRYKYIHKLVINYNTTRDGHKTPLFLQRHILYILIRRVRLSVVGALSLLRMFEDSANCPNSTKCSKCIKVSLDSHSF